MKSYQQLFENNKKWIQKKRAADKEFFTHLAESQNPDFLYVGCSDSRVSAEEMTGCEPGEMFVHRNIGNLVTNGDLNALTVVDYAVDHLHVKDIIICGHYNCGGVKAAMEQKNYGLLNPWLRNIRDVYRLHHEELNQIQDLDLRYKRLVELNVLEQCINVTKTAVVQKSYLKNKTPLIHGWVFDMHSGNLIDLNFDFRKNLAKIREIYDLGVNE